MKPAALGVHMHSGWGALIAVSRDAHSIELLDRRRIVIADPELPGAIQPYHFAAQLESPKQEKHLEHCAASSSRMAAKEIGEVVKELDGRNYGVVGIAILLASGRALPPLSKILAAHPLIHTAEGEFFRHAVQLACEALQIPVTTIRLRELDARAKVVFANRAGHVQDSIASLGRPVGPPWTSDHKTAALAAALILAGRESGPK
jgi:hypothetical protein